MEKILSSKLSQELALFQANRVYTNCLCQYGSNAKGVHWRNSDTQQLRFQLLCELLLKDDWKEGVSIHDFGCGYGELWLYLLRNGYRGSYCGYDMNASMITTAKGMISHPRASFIQSKTISATADYTLISGTFNLKMQASQTVWWRYIREQLRLIWQYSRKGMAFNLLIPERQRTPMKRLFYCDRDRLLSFCQTLSDKVEWKVEGSLGDINVYLRR